MEQIMEGMLDGVGVGNFNKILRTTQQTTRGNVALSKLLETFHWYSCQWLESGPSAGRLDAKGNDHHIPLPKKNSRSKVMKRHHEDWLLGRSYHLSNSKNTNLLIVKKVKTTKKPTYA
jgi:hypothetical protein